MFIVFFCLACSSPILKKGSLLNWGFICFLIYIEKLDLEETFFENNCSIICEKYSWIVRENSGENIPRNAYCENPREAINENPWDAYRETYTPEKIFARYIPRNV